MTSGPAKLLVRNNVPALVLPADSLRTAIQKTVAYADVFDYPLTAAEIHRYLAGMSVSAQGVIASLGKGDMVPRFLSQRHGFFTLPGREEIVTVRQERGAVAGQLWHHALRYGRMAERLPFVRMVAVTGSLAMDNPDGGADIDILVVAKNDRLWLCRAFIILLVRLAARSGVGLCPNYFLAERALDFPEHNLYAAHEVAQMIPLSGLGIYQEMRRINRWVESFLPNAAGPPQRTVPASGGTRVSRTLAELPWRGFIGGRLEQWEMRRKLRKFQAAAGGSRESSFSADWCKGHFEAHHERIIASYQATLAALGLPENE
jgi:hypothetical protein